MIKDFQYARRAGAEWRSYVAESRRRELTGAARDGVEMRDNVEEGRPVRDIKTVYIVQTIYVGSGFARLLDLISGFLSSGSWYVGEDREDSLRFKTAQKRWEGEKKEGAVGLVLYPGRSHYSIVGSGIGLRVSHVRRFVQEGTRSSSSVPRAIRAWLDGVPNVVEIDAHYRWYVDGRNFAILLGEYLTDKGLRVVWKSGRGGTAEGVFWMGRRMQSDERTEK